MDSENETPVHSQVGVSGKISKEKKDLVTASTCMKVLERVLSSHGVLNTETLPSEIPKSYTFVAKDQGKASRPWACPICRFPFKYRGNLAEHIRFYHMKGNVPCNRCSKKFATARLLRDHMREHSALYNKCPHCGKHFKTSKNDVPSSSYKFHIAGCKRKPKKPSLKQATVISQFKSIEQSIPSDIIFSENIEQNNIAATKQSVTFSDNENNSNESSGTNYCKLQNTLPLKCKKCFLEFEDEESVENHICMTLDSIEQLLINKSGNSDNQASLKCDKCGLEFEDKDSIENHLCVTLSSIAHLLNPMLSLLDEDDSKNSHILKCSTCTLVFEDEVSFENHLCIPSILMESEISNKDSSISKCNVCTLVFEDKESLENHICIPSILIEHESSNKQSCISKCNICTLEFEDKESLDNHICVTSIINEHEKFNDFSEINKEIHKSSVQDATEVTSVSNSFVSSSPSYIPASTAACSPLMDTHHTIDEIKETALKPQDSISFQIGDIFSLTQDQWKNHSEIDDDEDDSGNSIPLSSASSIFTIDEICEPKIDKICEHNSETCFIMGEEKNKMQKVSSILNEKELVLRKDTNQTEMPRAHSIHNHSHLNKDELKVGTVHSSQNDQSKTLINSNDLPEKEVNVRCGMCKSDFTQFNQFRFHYSLCKMLHLSTDNKIKNKHLYDAKCNVCSKTFSVVTDYVIHLETCKISPNSKVSENMNNKAPGSSFNTTLCNILTNCSILLLRGAEWECIKCSCHFSDVSSALSHYNDCKNAPFSSDTSSFAKYIRLICMKCNEVFIEVKDFKNHKSNCIPIVESSLSYATEVKVKKPKSYKWCTDCGCHIEGDHHPCNKLLKHMQSCFVLLKRLKTISLDSNSYKKIVHYQCNECNLNFTNSQEYVLHMRNSATHSRIDNSTKSTTPQLCSSVQNLQENVLVESCNISQLKMSEIDTVNLPPSASQSKKTLWKCKSCQIIYTSLLSLKQHVMSAHGNKIHNKYPFLKHLLSSADATQTKDSILSENLLTPNVTDTNITPEVHKSVEVVHNFWKCTTCNCQFNSNLALSEHMFACHTHVSEAVQTNANSTNSLVINNSNMFPSKIAMTGSIWKCNSCTASFSSFFELENHHLLFHQYYCSCGLAMNRLQATVHDKLMRGTHKIISNELPLFKQLPPLSQSDLKCTACFANFHSESSFLQHLNLFPHCSERYFLPSFICSLCQLQFSNKDLYLRHCTEVHSLCQNRHNATQSLQTSGGNQTSQHMQTFVESDKLSPSISKRTSVYQEHNEPPSVEVGKLSSSPDIFEVQITNNFGQSCSNTNESVSQSNLDICKGDGWIILGNTNCQENVPDYKNCQVVNYVCSRCYRSQKSYEHLTQHIKEFHNVNLHGTLKLATVQARKT